MGVSYLRMRRVVLLVGARLTSTHFHSTYSTTTKHTLMREYKFYRTDVVLVCARLTSTHFHSTYSTTTKHTLMREYKFYRTVLLFLS